jgi:hypothetical protein
MILAGLTVLADAKFLETSIKQFTREDVVFLLYIHCPCYIPFFDDSWRGDRQSLSLLAFLSLLSIVPEIPDDGLPAFVHMNMLDADKLLTAVTQTSKNLNLGRISPHQTSRS